MIACLVISITSLDIKTSVSPEEDNQRYWTTDPLGGIAAVWTIGVASIGIAIELILAPLRIITLKYCGNFTIIFGVLVRAIKQSLMC